MIEVRNLTKDYGARRAIDSLNFSVNKGEVVGFLGPNGAGKSTTMKIITGYMAPTSGSVSVAGYDVFENPIEVKKRIGFLPETPPLYMDMKVDEYLRYVAKLKGVPRAKLKSAVDDALAKTHITDVSHRLIQNLSKGYKQRVGIAQAIVSMPEILILDEPTVGLDPIQVAEIRTMISELRGQHTVILSTHILSEVQATCERIIIIHRGRIVAEDSLQKLNERMAGGKKLFVKVKHPTPKLKEEISAINGVRSVEASDGGILEITTDSDETVQENIATKIATTGAGLIEMRSQEVSLEDIFLKVTREEMV